MDGVLINRATADGIATGVITLVLRSWDAPRAKVGGTQRTSAGTIRIDDVTELRRPVTAAQAEAAGYPDAATARAELDRRPARHVYAIAVSYVGPDERPELAADSRFATNRSRVAHRDVLVGELETALADATAADWAERLQAVGIPCGPVNDLVGAFHLARRLIADPVITFADDEGPGIATVASPLHLAGTPVRYHRAPPRLGADAAEVKRWLAAQCPEPLTP